MKVIKISLLVLLLLINTIVLTGCWNYREVDEFSIVAGVAIDKGKNGKYVLTAEIVKISGGANAEQKSKLITMEGKSVFDAARNGISLLGRKFYWSHSKVIILSKEVAREGVIKVIDWYSRDSETRVDVRILISKEDTAGEIFTGKGVTEEIKSFAMEAMLKNQKSLGKAPDIDLLMFYNDLKAEGISAIAPAVSLKKVDGKKVTNVIGAAIFNSDKLVGFLNEEETKDLNFIRDEIKGGVLVVKGKDVSAPVTLEIFKNKTKVTPITKGKDIKIKLSTETTVAIDEIDGSENVIDEEGRKKLEKKAAEMLKVRMESLIKKIKSEYDTDVFGFGEKLREDENKTWDRVSGKWDEEFKNLDVSVKAKVHIRNSANLSTPMKERD
jgi:spore germination protein KC